VSGTDEKEDQIPLDAADFVRDVEKLGFSEKSQKSGDRKCPGDCEKSFLELPEAKQFVRILHERVFQQPPLFSTPIWKQA
jgi:hypothetical protein